VPQPCRSFIRRIILLTLLTFMSGCELFHSPPPPITQPVKWVEHVKALTLMGEWHIKGKVGIKQGKEGGSAHLDWIQSHDSFHITLSGPLGQGATIISGNKSGAKLENSDGTYIAETPEQLLYVHTGWNLPISNLLYWIKGLPEPRMEKAVKFNNIGLIENLSQGGWDLQFERYQNALGEPLPHKIKIYSDDLKVTVLVKQWILLDQE